MIELLVDMVRCVTEIDAGNNDVPSNLQPSQTALTAAAARAAHLIVDDHPRIFADVLASALLGDQADELLGYHRAHGTHPVLSSARAQVVCRSRFAEDRLAESIRRSLQDLPVSVHRKMPGLAVEYAWTALLLQCRPPSLASQGVSKLPLALPGREIIVIAPA